MQTLTVIIPILDDWDTLGELLPKFPDLSKDCRLQVDVVVIDDGSRMPAPDGILDYENRVIRSLKVLRLIRNVGHQRAIAVGLSYCSAHLDPDYVIVMDGDGQDSPTDIKALLAEAPVRDEPVVVFARRGARSEEPWFLFCYGIYRSLFVLLTGRSMRVGNFCLLTREAVERVQGMPELAIHFPTSLLSNRLTDRYVTCDRDTRSAGFSQMSFLALILHAIRSMMVVSEVVTFRAVIGCGIGIVLCLTGLCIVASIRWFTDLAIPGWATTAFASLIVLLVQLITALIFLVFIILQQRYRSDSYTNYLQLVRDVRNLR